jgi:hypothetical protein
MFAEGHIRYVSDVKVVAEKETRREIFGRAVSGMFYVSRAF